MTTITVIDIQTEAKFALPTTGDGNWVDWLGDQGYLICDRIPLGYMSLELYCCETSGLFALYHPPFQGLSTEYLFFNISSKESAQELVSLVKRMIGIISVVIRGNYSYQSSGGEQFHASS
jgi:hypothetical protein